MIRHPDPAGLARDEGKTAKARPSIALHLVDHSQVS
jgi:hypothetical protein